MEPSSPLRMEQLGITGLLELQINLEESPTEMVLLWQLEILGLSSPLRMEQLGILGLREHHSILEEWHTKNNQFQTELDYRINYSKLKRAVTHSAV